MFCGEELLQLDLRAGFFEFLLHLFGIGLGNASLDNARSAVDDRLGLLQAQAGNFLDSLDNSGLGIADLGEDDVELGFLFSSGSSSTGSDNNSAGSGGNAELLFDGLNQLIELENSQRLDLFNHSSNFFRSHEIYLHVIDFRWPAAAGGMLPQ